MKQYLRCIMLDDRRRHKATRVHFLHCAQSKVLFVSDQDTFAKFSRMNDPPSTALKASDLSTRYARRSASSPAWRDGFVWKRQTDLRGRWIERQCSRASRAGVRESSQVLSSFCGVRYEGASIRPLSRTMRATGNLRGPPWIINTDGQLTCDSPESGLGSPPVESSPSCWFWFCIPRHQNGEKTKMLCLEWEIRHKRSLKLSSD